MSSYILVSKPKIFKSLHTTLQHFRWILRKVLPYCCFWMFFSRITWAAFSFQTSDCSLWCRQKCMNSLIKFPSGTCPIPVNFTSKKSISFFIWKSETDMNVCLIWSKSGPSTTYGRFCARQRREISMGPQTHCYEKTILEAKPKNRTPPTLKSYSGFTGPLGWTALKQKELVGSMLSSIHAGCTLSISLIIFFSSWKRALRSST